MPHACISDSFSGSWHNHLNFVYVQYWQNKKGETLKNAFVIFIHRVCQNWNFLQSWGCFCELLGKFWENLLLCMFQETLAHSTGHQRCQLKPLWLWQSRIMNPALCHVPRECSGHWRVHMFCVFFTRILIKALVPF